MSYHNENDSNYSTMQVSNADFIVSIFASAGNKYQFNSSGIAAETIGLKEGVTYKFDLSDTSN